MAKPPSSETKGRVGAPSPHTGSNQLPQSPEERDALHDKISRERDMTWEVPDTTGMVEVEVEDGIFTWVRPEEAATLENQHTETSKTPTNVDVARDAPLEGRTLHPIYDKWRTDLRTKKGDQPWMAEETYRALQKYRLGIPADQVATPAQFALFDIVRKQPNWREKPLNENEAVDAAIALLRLNRQAYQLLTATDVDLFPAQPPESPFWKSEGMLCFRPLSGDERIASLTAILSRISKLTTEGKISLTEDQRQVFANTLSDAVLASGHQPSIDKMNAATGERGRLERWREVEPNESSSQYFERVIAPIPFERRPTMKALAASQPELFRSLTNLCADQKRFNRVGYGEAGRAKAVSELLPVGAPKPPRRSPKSTAQPE